MRGIGKITRRRQAGLATVEMVAITPVMLLLLLGIGEFGKALMEYNTLNKSVRDAARFVAGTALLGTTGTVQVTADIESAARNLVVFGNVAGTGNPLLPSLAADQISVRDAGNDLVVVQADYPYLPIMGPVLQTFGFGDGMGLDFTLTASVTMRAL